MKLRGATFFFGKTCYITFNLSITCFVPAGSARNSSLEERIDYHYETADHRRQGIHLPAVPRHRQILLQRGAFRRDSGFRHRTCHRRAPPGRNRQRGAGRGYSRRRSRRRQGDAEHLRRAHRRGRGPHRQDAAPPGYDWTRSKPPRSELPAARPVETYKAAGRTGRDGLYRTALHQRRPGACEAAGRGGRRGR